MPSNVRDKIEYAKNRVLHWEAVIAENKAKIKIMKDHILRLEEIIQRLRMNISEAKTNIFTHRQYLLSLDPKEFSEE